LIFSKKGPYAFVEYDEPEDAKIALKELNRSTLKGANGHTKARIEFAYKRKKNDKLEENDIRIDEDEDVFSDNSEADKEESHRKSSRERGGRFETQNEDEDSNYYGKKR
jgi:hypothetical protein